MLERGFLLQRSLSGKEPIGVAVRDRSEAGRAAPPAPLTERVGSGRCGVPVSAGPSPIAPSLDWSFRSSWMGRNRVQRLPEQFVAVQDCTVYSSLC